MAAHDRREASASRHRARGHASRARARTHAPGRPSFPHVVRPGPGQPGPFYLGLGFVPNGEVDDGEIVVVHPLSTPLPLPGRRPLRARLVPPFSCPTSCSRPTVGAAIAAPSASRPTSTSRNRRSAATARSAGARVSGPPSRARTGSVCWPGRTSSRSTCSTRGERALVLRRLRRAGVRDRHRYADRPDGRRQRRLPRRRRRRGARARADHVRGRRNDRRQGAPAHRSSRPLRRIGP